MGNYFIYALILGKVFDVAFCPIPHKMPEARVRTCLVRSHALSTSAHPQHQIFSIIQITRVCHQHRHDLARTTQQLRRATNSTQLTHPHPRNRSTFHLSLEVYTASLMTLASPSRSFKVSLTHPPPSPIPNCEGVVSTKVRAGSLVSQPLSTTVSQSESRVRRMNASKAA